MSDQTTQQRPYWYSDVPPPPPGSPGTPKPPHGHGRAWLIAAVVAALLLAAGGATAAGLALTHTTKPPAATQPTKPPAATQPTKPNTPSPAPAPSQYVRDIWNAGITAPASWIEKTGQTLVADWRAGYTSAWTDANVLGPGGVYPSHYAIFNQITEQHFGVHPPEYVPVPPPPPQADAYSVVSAYCSDITNGDYADAWNLLSPSMQSQGWGGSYSRFVSEFTPLGFHNVSEVSESGDSVTVTYTLYNTDTGSSTPKTATLTVDNGLITSSTD